MKNSILSLILCTVFGLFTELSFGSVEPHHDLIAISLSETIDSVISEIHSDTLLKNEIEKLGMEDQTLRHLLPDVEKKFGRDSEEYSYFWSLMDRQDSICIVSLVKILDEHGWVGKSRIGSEANQAIWLIIQHASLEIQEQFLPLLRESVKIKESEGWHLAFLQDRILMRNHKKQIYGTQSKWDHELKKNVIYPIEDVKNVNKKRKKLGLGTVEEHAEVNGYIFDRSNQEMNGDNDSKL
jgi:hypothetical protein